MVNASKELDVLRGFIDFINRQVGVYCDCLSGFSGNKARIERQIPRVRRPTSRRIEDGQPVIVWSSVEDPKSPDILHHRITRSEDFIAANAEAGFNEQQICWSIIVFLFTRWDEDIRPQIAAIRGVTANDVKVDALGDLRILRNSIVHNQGIISLTDHKKLKRMAILFAPNAPISPDHDEMHKIFVFIKQAVAELILDHTGHLPGAPKASDLVDVAIQNVRHKTPGNRYGFWTVGIKF
ncbi:hypothetical protein JQ604_28560 [Bradyrhizobium jicamae]|uniref:hypothetical protein n=1 Tax=Bradyrhizobium jicamae TaxID=280332 RepID=UPI001BA64817|nr:hypothetical protein [Bradyrhizobium jicamae]MBR0756146.1 hypothetical protein [Bradyrhizobium jicamae]